MIALISLTDAGNILKAYAVNQLQLINSCEGFILFCKPKNSIKDILYFVKSCQLKLKKFSKCALGAHLLIYSDD